MYIEKRKNAFYLKRSVWDKERKRVRSTSAYLGSDPYSASQNLKNYVTDCDEDEIKKLMDKIKELSTPTTEELLANVIECLSRAQSHALSAKNEELFDALSKAEAIIRSYKHK